MSTLTVEVMAVLSGNANGVDWEIDLAKVPADKLQAVVNGLIGQGARIIQQRAKADDKDKASRADKVRENVKLIEAGTYSFGGGGGGRTQIDTRLQAWKVYLGMEKKPNKEVQPAMLSFVMAQLVNNGVAKASDPGLTSLTAKYFDTVVKQVESDDPKWKEFHKAARLAAGELDDELPSFKLDLGKLQDAA